MIKPKRRVRKKTTPPRPRGAAEDLVKRIWKECDVPRGERASSLPAILREAEKLNKSDVTAALWNHIVLYDQFALWLVRLSTILMYGKRRQWPGHMVYRHVTAAICSLTISIRVMVLQGHDVSAKILLRSLREYVDLLVLLIVKPHLAPLFQEEDFEKSNSLWHQHVKSGKASREWWRTIAPNSESEQWRRDLSEWKKQEDTLLSLSAHPSYVAAAMVTAMPSLHAARLPPFVGQVSDSSIRTLVYAMFVLSELSMFARFPFGEKAKFRPLARYDRKNTLHVGVERGRRVLLTLTQFLAEDVERSPGFVPTKLFGER